MVDEHKGAINRYEVSPEGLRVKDLVMESNYGIDLHVRLSNIIMDDTKSLHVRESLFHILTVNHHGDFDSNRK
ncbi:hypothetical protein STEG23_017512, partial [Scotinomys teguina]